MYFCMEINNYYAIASNLHHLLFIRKVGTTADLSDISDKNLGGYPIPEKDVGMSTDPGYKRLL